MSPHDLRGREEAARFLRLAAALLVVGLGAGWLTALHYTRLSPALHALGLPLTALRAIHTGATVGWIFCAGMAVVHRWLHHRIGELPAADRIAARTMVRARAQRALWFWASIAAAFALSAGYSSGREYLEYPPILSVPIALGWLLFAWSFGEATGFRVRSAPVFAWMWATSVFLFLWTFAEAHAWLLEGLAARPVRDLAIQWKAYGSLVGSYNLLVYGAISWVGVRLSGSDDYARSNLAFWLFLLGILNSFTNYGHHTYHLPQSEWVKWVAFVVSMSEAIILGRVVWDCAGLARKWASRGSFPVVTALLVSTTAWTGLQLALAIVFSVPPINAYIHGTLAVPAHAMGSLVGIDTFALLAAGTWVVWEVGGEPARASRWGVRGVFVANVGLFGLWAGLLVAGVSAGLRRSATGELPWWGAFPAWLGPLLLVAGALLAAGIVTVLGAMWTDPGRAVTREH